MSPKVVGLIIAAIVCWGGWLFYASYDQHTGGAHFVVLCDGYSNRDEMLPALRVVGSATDTFLEFTKEEDISKQFTTFGKVGFRVNYGFNKMLALASSNEDNHIYIVSFYERDKPLLINLAGKLEEFGYTTRYIQGPRVGNNYCS